MFSFFKPKNENPDSWQTTLSNATGWLNPFNLVRNSVNSFTAVSLTLLHCIQPANSAAVITGKLATPFTLIDLLPVKYFLTCFTAAIDLPRALEKCNASMPATMLLPIEILKATMSSTQTFWQQTCLLTTQDNFLLTNSCIFSALNETAAQSHAIHPAYDYIAFCAQLFIGTLLPVSIVSYLVNGTQPRNENNDNGEQAMDFIHAIRNGELDQVNDYIRQHRPIPLASLRYAMAIAEQTQHDTIYAELALLLSEDYDDQPVNVIEMNPDPNTPETNEQRLKNINFDLDSVPYAMRDPVSRSIMDDPVTLSTGHNLDRSTLASIKKSGICRCPISNTNIEPQELDGKTNTGLKELIDEFVLHKITKHQKKLEGDNATPPSLALRLSR